MIRDILIYFLNKPSLLPGEFLDYKSPKFKINLNYHHPNKYGQPFLATSWLCPLFFKQIEINSFYNIICRIFSEQSFIFICDDIQKLTTLV